jgi:hypothetical protein
MTNLTLDFEWIDPAEAKGPELRATWAKLEIRVGDDSVTRLIDQSYRSVRNSLFLPLYPLAEWLTTHWWFLFHEIETLGRSTSDQYEKRHSIRYGAEGFALPTLTIRPVGESVRLDWKPAIFKAQNLEFTASGSLYVPSSEVRQTLADFISAVIKRLHAEGVESTLLEQEWQSIQETEPDELAFCAAVASLGLDPYVLNEVEQQDILAASELLPASVVPDFFALADWPSLLVQAHQVRNALASSRRNKVDLKSIKCLKRELSGFHLTGSPWDQGYRFAHEVRERLHLNGGKLSSMTSLSRALAVPPKDLETAIIKVSDLPASLDALVATNSVESPGFAVPEHRRKEAVRFAFCRALFEYLRVPEGESLLVTRAHSDKQKRNRAFAAEFLVPADLLREALPQRAIEDEEMDELAAAFGVSPSVIRHQIENHRLANLSSRGLAV